MPTYPWPSSFDLPTRSFISVGSTWVEWDIPYTNNTWLTRMLMMSGNLCTGVRNDLNLSVESPRVLNIPPGWGFIPITFFLHNEDGGKKAEGTLSIGQDGSTTDLVADYPFESDDAEFLGIHFGFTGIPTPVCRNDVNVTLGGDKNWPDTGMHSYLTGILLPGDDTPGGA